MEQKRINLGNGNFTSLDGGDKINIAKPGDHVLVKRDGRRYTIADFPTALAGLARPSSQPEPEEDDRPTD